MRIYGYLLAIALGAYQTYVLASIGAWVPAVFVGVALPCLGISQAAALRKRSVDLQKAGDTLFGILFAAQLGVLLTLSLNPLRPIIEALQHGGTMEVDPSPIK